MLLHGEHLILSGRVVGGGDAFRHNHRHHYGKNDDDGDHRRYDAYDQAGRRLLRGALWHGLPVRLPLHERGSRLTRHARPTRHRLLVLRSRLLVLRRRLLIWRHRLLVGLRLCRLLGLPIRRA